MESMLIRFLRVDELRQLLLESHAIPAHYYQWYVDRIDFMETSILTDHMKQIIESYYTVDIYTVSDIELINMVLDISCDIIQILRRETNIRGFLEENVWRLRELPKRRKRILTKKDAETLTSIRIRKRQDKP